MSRFNFSLFPAMMLLLAAAPAPQWQKFTDAAGEVYQVDMASVHRDTNLGKVVDGDIVVYVAPPDLTDFDPARMRRFWFNCHGQFMDITDKPYGPIDAPPNTVAGKLSQIVCSGS